ncbi:hypothetical protein [Blastococcus deserti]|uniref:Uncharacterized protein n=1 Tax=Blastococcus deserti TaxID=2259033 RepID=A0ABW4X9E0_9ACTN
MSPIKLSRRSSGDDREDTVDVDDALVDELRQVVDATPGLTLADAFREGIEHVIQKRRGGGQQ